MNKFPSIEEVHTMLDEIAEELPSEFFEKLNEGIVLLPEHKIHPASRCSRTLYIMGQYSRSVTGRNIKIYYGSFKKTYGSRSRRFIYNKFRNTLLHEFTHHLESLAGEKGLSIKDAERLKRYKRNTRT